jgi:integrase
MASTLNRYVGLHCPSETLALHWADIDWANNRFTVLSPKTALRTGKEDRDVPLFTELRQYLLDAFDPESVHVITRNRGGTPTCGYRWTTGGSPRMISRGLANLHRTRCGMQYSKQPHQVRTTCKVSRQVLKFR